VSSFEGVIGSAGRTPKAVEEVDRLLDSMHELAAAMVEAGLLDAASVVLSAGGSVYFDRVAERLLRPIAGWLPTVVLRSGCYVTHDHGTYAKYGPIADRPLRPALELIATVLSTPEPGVAIVNFGRRDAPFDAGLPVPLWVRSAGDVTIGADSMRVERLNDQHAWMQIAEDAGNVAVGDTVGFGISHPCTAFDKWRRLPLIDDDYAVIRCTVLPSPRAAMTSMGTSWAASVRSSARTSRSASPSTCTPTSARRCAPTSTRSTPTARTRTWMPTSRPARSPTSSSRQPEVRPRPPFRSCRSPQ
jgi:D-serine deaminase-like pyridoxal phosphate-dependent protein